MTFCSQKRAWCHRIACKVAEEIEIAFQQQQQQQQQELQQQHLQELQQQPLQSAVLPLVQFNGQQPLFDPHGMPPGPFAHD